MQVHTLGWEDVLEKGIADYPNMLAWRLPRTEELGGLQSMESQVGGHIWSSLTQAEAQIQISTVLLQYIS